MLRTFDLMMPHTPFLQHRHRLIQHRRQHTQDHDRHDHEVQFENLAAVDDEKAEACLRGEKFPDDDADETETDVDLHVADDKWNRAGQQDLCEDILLFSSQRVDQTDLVRIHGEKAVVER